MTPGRSRFAVLQWAMASVFAFAALLQWNDPDPLQWMALYGGACAVSVWAASRPKRCPAWVPLGVGGIAAVWAGWIASHMGGGVRVAELFASWEMKNARVELARETGGLAIVALWMAVTAWGIGRRRQGADVAPGAGRGAKS